MRRYETILIAHVDLSEDELNQLISRYETIITGQKGILVKVERWGKRKLAYLVRKQARGTYVLFEYAGASGVVNELERNLKIDDRILKFMTVFKEEAVDPEALQKEIAEAAKKAENQEAPALEASSEPAVEETSPVDTAAAPPSDSENTQGKGE